MIKLRRYKNEKLNYQKYKLQNLLFKISLFFLSNKRNTTPIFLFL